MRDDKTISRIRQVRHAISAKYGHDVAKLVKHYIKMQIKNKHRIVGSKETSVASK